MKTKLLTLATLILFTTNLLAQKNTGGKKITVVKNKTDYSANLLSTCGAEGATITPDSNFSALAGSPSLNLSLSPAYGNVFTPAGTITDANPSAKLSMFNTANSSCAVYGDDGGFKYDLQPFIVTVPGTYTFTPSNYGLVYNLYQGSFDPAFPCNNFIASNAVTNNGSNNVLNPSITVPLTRNQKYVLVAGTYNASFPTLPFSYSVAVSGGSIYTNPPDPGASYNYAYVIVNNATNIIKAISLAADLSSAADYPGGNSFTVYGLSYSNSSSSFSNFIGKDFSTLQNALVFNSLYCGNLSKNSKKVIVTNQYIFTGNGNWDIASNWDGGNIPPSPVPPFSEIIINPIDGGQCILNVPVTIPRDCKLTVQPNKQFKILGNLFMQ